MEQKLVQHCETKVDADACKASYPSSRHNTDTIFNRPGVAEAVLQ